jgi:hypothetical protein
MISRMPTHSTRQLFSQNGTGADSVQPDLYRGKLPSGLECPTWTGHRRLLPCGHPHQLQLGLHQRPWARHSRHRLIARRYARCRKAPISSRNRNCYWDRFIRSWCELPVPNTLVSTAIPALAPLEFFIYSLIPLSLPISSLS